MAAPTNQTPANPDIAQAKADAAADKKFQLDMLSLQREITSQNTTMNALSSIQKGNDDVLRAMANNLK